VNPVALKKAREKLACDEKWHVKAMLAKDSRPSRRSAFAICRRRALTYRLGEVPTAILKAREK
jgi:hypothetical protein